MLFIQNMSRFDTLFFKFQSAMGLSIAASLCVCILALFESGGWLSSPASRSAFVACIPAAFICGLIWSPRCESALAKRAAGCFLLLNAICIFLLASFARYRAAPLCAAGPADCAALAIPAFLQYAAGSPYLQALKSHSLQFFVYQAFFLSLCFAWSAYTLRSFMFFLAYQKPRLLAFTLPEPPHEDPMGAIADCFKLSFPPGRNGDKDFNARLNAGVCVIVHKKSGVHASIEKIGAGQYQLALYWAPSSLHTYLFGPYDEMTPEKRLPDVKQRLEPLCQSFSVY